MTKYIDPFKEYHRAAAALPNSLDEYRKTLASLPYSLDAYRKTLASLPYSLDAYRKTLASLPNSLDAYRKALASLPNSLDEYRKTLASLPNSLDAYRKALASLPNSLDEYRTKIPKYQDAFSTLSSDLPEFEAFIHLREVASAVEPELSEEGITLASLEIISSELQELSDQIVLDASSSPAASLEEAINNLIEAIEAQRDTTIQKLLMWFFCPLVLALIMSIANPIVEHHLASYLKSDKRVLAKEIKASVKSSVSDTDVLSSYRYVSADILNVRMEASQKSDIIGYLRFGHVVTLIEKKKKWSLVEWNDSETNSKITGWVFTRYLKKFG